MRDVMPLDYLAPRQLEANPTPIRQVQLIGGCIFDAWPYGLRDLQPETRFQNILFDHSSPGQPPDECDLRIVQVPLRTLWSEWVTMPLGYESPDAHGRILDSARDTLSHFFSLIPPAAAGTPTLFLNYLSPQQNALGRLLPRYDHRNPIYFIECLNRLLDELAGGFPNGHVLDADHIASVFGRRFVQDDPFWVTAHGGFINDHDWHTDAERLEPEAPLSERYEHDQHAFIRLLWREAVAMLRTLRGADRIKMVCIDLDDTLWRGVLAEQGEVDIGAAEGWPLGFAEALTILRKRGVILAIVSKNDERFIEETFPKIFGARLPLGSFPIRKINWRSKAENLKEAIAEANLLPDSVLFIDDNPIERDLVRQSFPGIRVLGAPHLDWRRILLWAPELQLPALSAESLQRNEMIAAQVERERSRALVSPEEFLAKLQLQVEFGTIETPDHPRFQRAVELLNKTNQFNTTGRRWTDDEARAHLLGGGRWVYALVRDSFTSYGLVSVALLQGSHMEQMVMSCRVFGLGIERAVVAELARMADEPLTAALIPTDRNGPCQPLFRNLGWKEDAGMWAALEPVASPAHITISHEAEAAPATA